MLQKLPIGLLNIGENVCFFNIVIQDLNSIPSFRSTSDLEIQALKRLFLELQISSIAVRAAKYLQVLYLNDYISGQQYDAHECLVQLLQKFYPEINDDCIFRISLLESTMCEGNRGHSTKSTFSCTELGLQVEDSLNIETITGLLEKSQNPVLSEGYQCDKCGNVGTSRKADLVTYIINYDFSFGTIPV